MSESELTPTALFAFISIQPVLIFEAPDKKKWVGWPENFKQTISFDKDFPIVSCLESALEWMCVVTTPPPKRGTLTEAVMPWNKEGLARTNVQVVFTQLSVIGLTADCITLKCSGGGILKISTNPHVLQHASALLVS